MERSFIAQWTQWQRKLSGNQTSTAWTPNTDMYEAPEGLVIRMEVAGAAAGEVQIQLEEQVLVVRGVRRGPASGQTAAGVRYRQMEIEYGPFERILSLPFAVDGAGASALFQGGFLEIKLPRARNAQPTRIQIQVP